MTPEQHLANVQRRFDEFVDFVITSGPPTPPWTMGDARALFAPGFDIAAELVDALVASAKAAVDEATATDLKRQAAALPSQFGFFAETIIAHWKRNQGKPRPIDLSRTGGRSFGQILVDKGVITPEQLNQAREVQKQAPGDLGDILSDLEYASEREITAARAAALGLQFVDLSRTPVEPDALARVPEHIVRRYNILPIRLDATSSPNKLMVAVGDIQRSMAGIDEVRLVSRCQITPVLAAPSDITDVIARIYGKPPK